MTGTVTKTKLKGGRVFWGYYFRAGRNADGKWTQVVKKGFSTKKEAKGALRRALAEHESNPSRRDPRTFAEVFDTWIREHCERNCEPTTTEGYIAKGSYANGISGIYCWPN